MTPTPTPSPIALVTGGSGGVGQALLARLRRKGVRVAITSRKNLSAAEANADACICADTTTPAGAAQAMAACQELLGGAPTLLAHLVGNTLIASLHRSSEEQVREVLRVNLESSIWVLQAWIKALNGQAGSAVLSSSVVAGIGVANHEAIAAAKGGIEALVRSAAASYAKQGVRVNAVAPGLTETPMTAAMLSSPALREAAGKQYPLGGVQSADHVAAAIDWLLCPEAERITGQILSVDGGFTHIRPLVR